MHLDRRKLMLSVGALAVLGVAPAAVASVDPWAGSPWRRLTPAAWRTRLPPAAFAVLREAATERPFSSPLDKGFPRGTYVCLGCGLPLFRSQWKYDSGTGWPSFWDRIPGALVEKPDFNLLEPRTEYHCARCLGHQGHVFNDGPRPTGLRYCNNGVALRFAAA